MNNNLRTKSNQIFEKAIERGKLNENTHLFYTNDSDYNADPVLNFRKNYLSILDKMNGTEVATFGAEIYLNKRITVNSGVVNTSAIFKSSDTKVYISFMDSETSDSDQVRVGAVGNNYLLYAEDNIVEQKTKAVNHTYYKQESHNWSVSTGQILYPSVYDSANGYSDGRSQIVNVIGNMGDVFVNLTKIGGSVSFNRLPSSNSCSADYSNWFNDKGGDTRWVNVSPSNPVVITIDLPNSGSGFWNKDWAIFTIIPGWRNQLPVDYKVEYYSEYYDAWRTIANVVGSTSPYIKAHKHLTTYPKQFRVTVTKAGDEGSADEGRLSIARIIGIERYVGAGRFSGYGMSACGDEVFGNYKFVRNNSIAEFNATQVKFESLGTTSGSDVLIIDKDNNGSRASLQVQGNGGNTESLFVASNGRVAIGRTDPAYLLHLESQNDYASVFLEGNTSGHTNSEIIHYSANDKVRGGGSFWHASNSTGTWYWGITYPNEMFGVNFKSTNFNRNVADSANSYFGIQTDGRIRGNSFASGWSGSCWSFDHNVTTPNTSTIETDDLFIRGNLNAYQMVIHNIDSINGSQVISAGNGKIASINGSVITIEDPSSNNVCSFDVNDIILIQEVAVDNSVVLKRIVRKVTAVSGNNITIGSHAYAPSDTGTIKVGDAIVVIGNETNINRQASIYSTTVDSNAPFVRVMDGVSSWNDWTGINKIKAQYGNLDGITFRGKSLSGYGFVSENAYLSGEISVDSLAKMPGDENLMVHYRFIEHSDVMANDKFLDISGSGNNATALSSMDIMDSPVGEIAHFNNDYIYLDQTLIIPIATGATISLWAKLDQLDSPDGANIVDSFRMISETMNDYDNFIDLRTNQDGSGKFSISGEGYDNNLNWGLTTEVDADTEWHLWTFIFIDGFTKVYLDGEFIGEDDWSGAQTNKKLHVKFVGAGHDSHASYGTHWKGGLTDLRIYNVQLTSNEVKALYTNGAHTTTTLIRGNEIVTGLIKSNNWSTSAGSLYNLNDGTQYLGGSSAPKFSWNGSDLSIVGSVTITGGAGISNFSDAGNLVGMDEGEIDGSNIINSAGWTNDNVANSKIKTFVQSSIPTASSVGDLWIETDNLNKMWIARSLGSNEKKAGEWEEFTSRFKVGATTITNGIITTSHIDALNITANSVTSSWVYAGNISADQISAGVLEGITIKTSGGGDRIEMSSANARRISFKTDGSTAFEIYSNDSGGVDEFCLLDFNEQETFLYYRNDSVGTQLNFTAGAIKLFGDTTTGNILFERRKVDKVYTITSGATIDVELYSYIELNYSSTTTVTDFTDATAGQEIELYKKAGAIVTIQNNSNIKLAGGNNRILATGDSMVLRYGSDSIWHEKGTNN